jgi:hypothetical protein
MSFDHKAFEFNWQAFSDEMLPWLSEALAADDCERLSAFVDTNASACRSPYDGEPLSRNWRAMLEVGDAQEIADFALTKYYDPTDDHGLSDAWMELDGVLPADMRAALLGQAITHFDPGRQGSYFLAPADAMQSGELLQNAQAASLREFASFVTQASRTGHGVYVTF